jgi:hypothetical protein
MIAKSWNVRDQTEKDLSELLEKKYKEIENDYKLLRKISDMETAKKMIDEIWQCKSFANAIELELIRRGFYNGATS